MSVAGLTDTRSSDSDVTDSAAGATVYATGVRTYNGAIGVGDQCKELFAADSAAVMQDPASCDPLESVFDLAWDRGIATGLVSTSSLTHASPASFGSKVPYRRMQAEIASQLAANPIDVLLGGAATRYALVFLRARVIVLARLITCAAVGLGVGVGASAVLSQLYGEGDHERLTRITTHSLLLVAVLGLIAMTIGLATIDPVFRRLGADERTLPLVREYMEVYYFGGFLLILPLVGNFVMRSVGDARLPAHSYRTAE